jgi:hypothetical protein
MIQINFEACYVMRLSIMGMSFKRHSLGNLEELQFPSTCRKQQALERRLKSEQAYQR